MVGPLRVVLGRDDLCLWDTSRIALLPEGRSNWRYGATTFGVCAGRNGSGRFETTESSCALSPRCGVGWTEQVLRRRRGGAACCVNIAATAANLAGILTREVAVPAASICRQGHGAHCRMGEKMLAWTFYTCYGVVCTHCLVTTWAIHCNPTRGCRRLSSAARKVWVVLPCPLRQGRRGQRF
jgi:hypothetical protein